jgi:hypothetical protein
MPTQLPRVNVTVTQEQHALLLELAALDKGRTAAGFMRELLDQVTPVLRATVAMMRVAAQEQVNARSELVGMLAEVQALVEQRSLPLPPVAPSGRTAATPGARSARPARRKTRQ